MYIGRASTLDSEYVLILGVTTVGLRRSNVQCCGCSTSVCIGHCGLQYIVERLVSIPSQLSVRGIDFIVNTNNRTKDDGLASRGCCLGILRQIVGQHVIHGLCRLNLLPVVSSLCILCSCLNNQCRVANPRILNSLNTVEVEVRNEYQALQNTAQADGSGLHSTFATLNTEQSKSISCLHSRDDTTLGLIRISEEADLGVLYESTVLVQVEATSLSVGYIVDTCTSA